MRSRSSGRLFEQLFVQKEHEQAAWTLHVDWVDIDQHVKRGLGLAFSTDDEVEVIQVSEQVLGLHHLKHTTLNSLWIHFKSMTTILPSD